MLNKTARCFLFVLTLVATSHFTEAVAHAATASRYVGDGEIADFAIEMTGGDVTLYLAQKPINEPLQRAKVSLQLSDASSGTPFEEATTPGTYKLKMETGSLEKSQVIIETGEDSDIVDVTAATVGDASAGAAPTSSTNHDERAALFWTLAFVLGLVLGIAGTVLSSRLMSRRAASLSFALVGLAASLTTYSDYSFAHEGHEHGAPTIDDQSESGAAITLFKKAQFMIGLRTVQAKLEDIPDRFVSYGHIIAKPQQDTYILAPQAGSLRGSQNLVLGQKVSKGQNLAVIETVGRISLTAPFEGQILEILAAEGTRVEAGAKLFRITDPSTVWVDAELYEADLAKFNKVTSASVGVEGSAESYPAKILNFMTPINEETRTAKGFLELDNSSGKLRLGSFVSIHFSLPSDSKGISLPAASIVTRSGEELVFVQTGPESFEARSVVTQKGAEPGAIVITSGVKDGDRVVVSGSYQLLMKAR